MCQCQWNIETLTVRGFPHETERDDRNDSSFSVRFPPTHHMPSSKSVPKYRRTVLLWEVSQSTSVHLGETIVSPRWTEVDCDTSHSKTVRLYLGTDLLEGIWWVGGNLTENDESFRSSRSVSWGKPLTVSVSMFHWHWHIDTSFIILPLIYRQCWADGWVGTSINLYTVQKYFYRFIFQYIYSYFTSLPPNLPNILNILNIICYLICFN